jgi:hypothetical protein
MKIVGTPVQIRPDAGCALLERVVFDNVGTNSHSRQRAIMFQCENANCLH